jgi:spermidine/putrescine-binding protein
VTEQELLEKAIKAAEEFSEEYADDLKALQQIERAELIQELEAKKKENFQKISDACLQEYEKKYGARPEDEHWIYMVSDYYGTGDGRTLCVCATQAVPCCEEDFTEEDRYSAVTTQEYRAVREFHKHFGTWNLYGIEFVSKEDFFGTYAHLLPPALVNLKDKDCYLNYHAELHFNFS